MSYKNGLAYPYTYRSTKQKPTEQRRYKTKKRRAKRVHYMDTLADSANTRSAAAGNPGCLELDLKTQTHI